MKFLIDECLTVDLVSIAMQSGHQAHHVAHIGKAGWKDWNVAAYATNGDFVLVTNNASDFTTKPRHRASPHGANLSQKTSAPKPYHNVSRSGLGPAHLSA